MLKASYIKKIQTLVNVIGYDSDSYRKILSYFDVASSKDLTIEQASVLIEELEQYAIKHRNWVPKNKTAGNYESYRNREGFITPEQLKLIEGFWAKYSEIDSYAERKKALNTFVKNKFNISCIEWLPSATANKVIKVLRIISKQNRNNSTNNTTQQQDYKAAL